MRELALFAVLAGAVLLERSAKLGFVSGGVLRRLVLLLLQVTVVGGAINVVVAAVAVVD